MSRSFRTGTLSTFNDVECEATKGSFLVSRLHVEPSLVRRLDDLGERDFVFAALLHRHTTCVDGFHGAHGIALDARNLDQSTDGVARHSQVVLHADFRRVLHMEIVSTQCGCQPAGRHRAGDSHLSLAPHFRAPDIEAFL